MYQEIPLTKIETNPSNPRKHFEGPKFDELVASVRQKGVIEPIIVRPLEGSKVPFQIVAGERRFRAALACKQPTIPAIIRDLTADEAYDFMLIENLQREDLTELEEAESFKAYADRHAGEGSIESFAEKTGISPRYIRARIHVLALPKDVLAMWKDGKLKYGHLEQLLRVDDPETRVAFIKRFKARDDCHRIKTVAELKEEIDELQVGLSSAHFPTKTECAGCRNNSTVQQDLFGLGSGKVSCSKPDCFTEKQRAWLTAHWIETSFHKIHKTNGFRFDDECQYGSARQDFEGWNGATKPTDKCFSCDSFVTIIDPDGRVRQKRSCTKPACFKALEQKKSGNAKKQSDKPAARASWHGEYFRDKFLRPKIEAKIPGLPFAASDGLTVLLAAIAAKEPVDTLPAILGFAKGGRYGYYDRREAVRAIMSAKADVLFKTARAMIADFVMEGQSVDEAYRSDHFNTADRVALARFLGIDLAKEYSVNREYLEKKTTAEILAFIKKHDLAKLPAFQKALKFQAPEKAKKSELVAAVLAIGAGDLVGKVPDEILGEKKKK